MLTGLMNHVDSLVRLESKSERVTTSFTLFHHSSTFNIQEGDFLVKYWTLRLLFISIPFQVIPSCKLC